MYFPANPYEPVKYITYILLAVAFVSMVWNRCNERNPYTKTWYIGFIGANLIIPFILVQGVQFNLTSQSIFVDMGEIAKGYFIPLLAITAVVLLFTGAVSGVPHARDNEIQGFRWVSQKELENYLLPDIVRACTELTD